MDSCCLVIVFPVITLKILCVETSNNQRISRRPKQWVKFGYMFCNTNTSGNVINDNKRTRQLRIWKSHWHAHTRKLPWGLPEVVGTIQQVHCSRRRLLRRGLEFHVSTISKSAHTKKSLETYLMILVYIFNWVKTTCVLGYHRLLNKRGIKDEFWAIGLMSCVHQWSGKPGFTPRSSHTKDSKMVLDATLLNTHHYKVRIKGKVEQSREWSSTLPYTSV